MKRISLVTLVIAVIFSISAYSQQSGKLVSSKTHIKFNSTTPAEDIEANNYASVSTINTESGEVVFSVPMQSFEFEKSLMQKHFNQDKFLDTKNFPKAKLKAKITNLADIDFSKEGSYNAKVEGELTIKGVTKPISEMGTLVVKGKTVEVKSVFNITLADFGVSFAKGKTASNIAKAVEVTALAEYPKE